MQFGFITQYALFHNKCLDMSKSSHFVQSLSRQAGQVPPAPGCPSKMPSIISRAEFQILYFVVA